MTIDGIKPCKGQRRLVINNSKNLVTPIAGLLYEISRVDEHYNRCIVCIIALPIDVRDGWWSIGELYGWDHDYATIVNSVEV